MSLWYLFLDKNLQLTVINSVTRTLKVGIYRSETGSQEGKEEVGG